MKQITDTETAFNNFKQYIDKRNYLPKAKSKLQEFSDACKIDLSQFIDTVTKGDPDLFTLPAETIKQLVEILDNSSYANILKEVETYSRDLCTKKKTPQKTSNIVAFNELCEYFKRLYSNFCDKKSGHAYKMIKDLGLSACPYCNLNYTDAIIKEENNNIVRPHLDHFYPKSKYPFFAVSFYNLVPSCYECNSGLKGDDILTINPYLDDFDSMAEFNIKLTGKTKNPKNLRDTDAFDITLDALNGISDVESYKTALELDIRYSYKKDIVSELLVKTDEKTKEIFNQLRYSLCLQGYSNRDIDLIIYGNYTTSDDINKRPLAKLVKDILRSE